MTETEKKVDLTPILCTRCKTYHRTYETDKTKPAERCEFYNGSDKEAQWNVLHPIKETADMLCYVCQKKKDKLMNDPITLREVTW